MRKNEILKHVIFRDFHLSDLPKLVVLANRAFQHGSDSYWAVVGARRIEKTIVAEYQGQLIGAIEIEVLCLGNQKHGHIGYIFVDPEFRRLGIGSRLLKLAEDWFIKRDAEFAWALTTPDNIVAQKFFLKHGYEIVSKSDVFQMLGRKYAKKLLWRMVYWEGDIIFRKRLVASLNKHSSNSH